MSKKTKHITEQGIDKPVSKEQFINKCRNRVIETCIGASTVRGQNYPGLLNKSRMILTKIDVNTFYKALNNYTYNNFLDRETLKFIKAFGKSKKPSWGITRKILNLYFRDLVYNSYISGYYRFNIHDKSKLNQMEVPLDSFVARGINDNKQGLSLPKWTTIKDLKSELSLLYQQSASEKANALNIARPHLDLFLWREKNKK